MPETFKALVINQDGENFSREVKELNFDFLNEGEVLVKICLLYTSPSPRD